MKASPLPLWRHAPHSRAWTPDWFGQVWQFATYGLWRDLRNAWIRARYGWCPDDTWELGRYLARVMGGSLRSLAEQTHGAPAGYPHVDWMMLKDDGTLAPWDPAVAEGGPFTDIDQWKADLARWADAFEAWAVDEEGSDHKRFSMEQAMREMTTWFPGLWD